MSRGPAAFDGRAYFMEQSMKGRRKGLSLGLLILALTFSLAGCVQSASIQQHEQVEMVPQPSGQSTDWSLYEDMEEAR